jgi:branched-chain amino acid aminotransferase
MLHVNLSVPQIKSVIIEFVQRNRPTVPFYIRPLVYTSGLGIAPRLHQIENDFLVYGLELNDYLPKDGIRCRISSWQRQSDVSMPLRGKLTSAYIVSALAKTEAVESGFNERPITEKLKAELTAITNKQNLSYQDWIDTVILS